MITSRMDLGGKYIATSEVGQVKAFFQQPHVKAGFAAAALLATGIAAAPTAPCAVVAGAAMIFAAGTMLQIQRKCVDEAQPYSLCIETKPQKNEKTDEILQLVAEGKANTEKVTKWIDVGGVVASMGCACGYIVVASGPVVRPSEIAFGLACGALLEASTVANSFARTRRWANVMSGKWVLKKAPPVRKTEKLNLKTVVVNLMRPSAPQPV